MPGPKLGRDVPCCVCGKLTYKSANYLARGFTRMTCGDLECKSKKFMGENNPFWGRSHTPETMAVIKAKLAANPPKGTGPKKGVFKQTSEARAKMSAALKLRWAENRDLMLSRFPRTLKPKEELRYRRNFTPLQRREWTDIKCAWCETSEQLVLDHIIPVMCGGDNERRNAQTLCQPCNMWKMFHVDRPLRLAGLVNGAGGRN